MSEEHSGSGAPVWRHSERAEPVTGEETPAAEAIEAHVERHIGSIGDVLHEIVSEYVHLDVLHVAPSSERPWHTLVTCGMSARPMKVPDPEVPAFAELTIGLPPDWPLDRDAFEDERHYWPIRLLKELGRLPHAYDTWLGRGHTIPNGDPPEPYGPDTKLCGALIGPPLMWPSEAHVLEADERSVHFYGVIALHRDEMDLKLERGYDALFEPFERAAVSEMVEADRPSALRRRKRFGLF